jgi:hypothetical protein
MCTCVFEGGRKIGGKTEKETGEGGGRERERERVKDGRDQPSQLQRERTASLANHSRFSSRAAGFFLKSSNAATRMGERGTKIHESSSASPRESPRTFSGNDWEGGRGRGGGETEESHASRASSLTAKGWNRTWRTPSIRWRRIARLPTF